MSRNEMKDWIVMSLAFGTILLLFIITLGDFWIAMQEHREPSKDVINLLSMACLLYTSPSPRDVEESRMPSSA